MGKIKSIVVNFEDGTSQTLERPIIVPVPDDPPAPAPRKNNVGVNLPAVRYYSSARVFNDLAKTISPWVACTDAQWGAGVMPATDPITGVPKTGIPGGYVASVLDLKKGHPNGEYFLKQNQFGLTVDNRALNVFKTKDEQRLLFRVRAGCLPFEFSELSIFDTFNEDFLHEMSLFSSLRFMNWNRTNSLSAEQAVFANRVTPAWYTQADREVALEYQIELCNKLQKPFWYNVHHTASDSTVREVAKTIDMLLSKSLPVRVEYTNEAWNNQFQAHKYCLDRSPSGNAMEYHLRRTVEVGRIFKEVLGSSRVKTCLGSFTFGHETLQYVIRRASVSEATLDEIDEVAIAPYFGHAVTPATKASLNLDSIFADCRSELVTLLGRIDSWVKYSKQMGWALLAYEAGQHLVVHPSEHGNTGLINAYSAANRDERMGELYSQFLKQWDDLTDKAEICLFEHCSLFDRYGNWGLLEYHNQPLDDTPKMRAVLGHMIEF